MPQRNSGYVVRGIPNHGNTCYVNALVQCFLVLGKLRERMLGPDAPLGILGTLLQDLFVETAGTDNVRHILDPTHLLQGIRSGDPKFAGKKMHDSHELLNHFHTALGQEGAPTVPDTIFRVGLRVTWSCKWCSIESVSHDEFYDLSIPIQAKDPPAKSVASSPSNKGPKTESDIHKSMLQEVERGMGRDKGKIPAMDIPIAKSDASSPSSKSKRKTQETAQPVAKSRRSQVNTISGIERLKAKTEAKVVEGGDSHIPCSKLEDVFMKKTPRPLGKIDSSEVKHIWQSEDVGHGPLQTQKDGAPGDIIQVPVEGIDEPRDCFPSREKNEHMASSIDVEKNEDDNSYPIKITAEDKGKSWSDTVYDKANDITFHVSIEDCLALYFKKEVIEKICENCQKVARRSSTNTNKIGEQTKATTNENTTVHDDQTEQLHKKICQVAQSGDLKSLALECTSSRQPHDCDAANQFVLTEGTISRMNCNEGPPSCRTANKKPKCHDERVEEAVRDCLPTEKHTNTSSAHDSKNASTLNQDKGKQTTSQDSKNASTLNQDKGKQVKLDLSAHQVKENKKELKYTSGYATETWLFSKLPPVLIIHLKRTEVGHVKVRGHVRFEEILDVGKFMDPSSEDKDNSTYHLAGVIEHRGGLNAEVGHNVAYVRSSHQQQSTGSSPWLFASDIDINAVTLGEVLACKAYILFYERMES